MDDHPTPAELEAFVWDHIPDGRAQVVIAHLVSGCSVCRAGVAPHLKGILGRADPPPRVLTPQEDAAFEAAFDRAFSATVKKAQELRQQWKHEALALLNSGLDELPEVPPQLRGVPFFEALLEQSWSLRHEDPAEMVRLAAWAQVLAEKLEPGDLLKETQVADLRCRAWIELANSYRVADDLAEADSALGRAADLFLEGTQDENLAARFFDVQASLYGDQRHFDLADTALNFVYGFHMRHGDRHLAGRAVIKKGIFTGYRGDSEEAIRLLEKGLELIDERRDPRLVYLVFHNQIRLLLDCGRARDARIALFHLKARGLDPGGKVTELKLRWLEAQINAELGELDRAEQALLEVKQAFEEADLGYKAALAGLELAAVTLRRGRTGAAIREVLQAADVFHAIGVKREARASLLLLRKSFEREAADAKLLDYVIGLLRRGEPAAGARLEPSDEE